MGAGVAPDWVAQVLPLMLWAAAAAGAVWVVLAALDYYNRRAYNLTMGDRGGAGGRTPDFLKVDKAKREAARQAGETFDAKVAARDAAEASAAAGAPPEPSKALTLARLATIGFAAISIVTVAVGAIGRIEYYDEAVRRLSNWERLTEIISAYWIGFVVVALMIAAQIYHAVRQAGSS